jgi:DNA-binding PadR family transcriptional regulator
MRAQRGDVRTAVLLLLEEQPMHGYQLMQGIAERTGGAWTPSPGAVYPTINQLEDEGLVTVTADSGRKLVTLTDAGREHLAEHRETWADPFAGYEASAPGQDLRLLVHELHEATRVLARAGDDEQRAAAAKILSDARRALYLLLANGSSETPDA